MTISLNNYILSITNKGGVKEMEQGQEVRYSVIGLARELGVDRKTIYNWRNKGYITPKKTISGRPYYTQEDVQKILGQ